MHNSELLIYQAPAGNIKIDVRLEDETVLTQAHMAELFGKGKKTISEHSHNKLSEISGHLQLTEKLRCPVLQSSQSVTG
jgi:hypothetical protein